MAELPWRCCLLLLLVLLQATARAASLPGLPEVFEVDEEGRWTLGRELPEAFRAAGLRPGWELLAVDGMGLDELGVVQRRVAAGPARLVQLRLLVTEPLPPQEGEAEGAAEVDPAEVIEAPEPGEELAVLVPRAELVYAEVVGELPWPEGFAPLPLLREEPVAWQETFDGQPVLRDGAGDAWRVDPRTGSFARSGPRELFERQIPAVFWSLSEAAWVLDQGELLESGDAQLREQGATYVSEATARLESTVDDLVSAGTIDAGKRQAVVDLMVGEAHEVWELKAEVQRGELGQDEAVAEYEELRLAYTQALEELLGEGEAEAVMATRGQGGR